MNQARPRLAVIGTGIAGLAAAWLLREDYDVVVFESQPRAGMGVHTIDYASNGIEKRIDIPLRIFTEGYYENLFALYEHIGVKVLASDHAGLFANDEGDILLHYGNLDWSGLQLSYPRGRSLLRWDTLKIALQSRRFFARARRDKDRAEFADISFGEYLERSGTGQLFIDTILLPMMSVTCTCDYQTVLDYPADIMLGYLGCGVQEVGIMSAAGGVDDIVPRLLTGVELRTSSAIAGIKPEGEQLRVATSQGDVELFDHVVVAAQAQQVARMLDGFDRQQALLEAVPFERSAMSVHTDRDILPTARADASPVSYYLPRGGDRAEVSVDLTKAIPRLQGMETVFQTWNPIQPIAANRELARVEFTRPAVTLSSRRAVAELRASQDEPGNRLWFCGSYMADKIPLLEAAVDSSIAVAERLGAAIPWKTAADS